MMMMMVLMWMMRMRARCDEDQNEGDEEFWKMREQNTTTKTSGEDVRKGVRKMKEKIIMRDQGS